MNPPTAGDDPSATQVLPSWLLDEPLSAAQLAAQTSAASADDQSRASTDEELPPWLASTDAPSGASVTEDVPAWLTSTDAPSGTSTNEELPPWLASTDQPASEQHTTQVYDVPTDDTPAWLSADTPSGAQIDEAPERSSSSGPEAEAVELPAWLSDSSSEAQGTPASTATDLPPWLADMSDQPVAAQPTHGLPAWLDESSERAPAADKQAGGQSELLGGLDLPAWLRDDKAATSPPQPVESAPTWLQREEPEPEEATPQVVAIQATPAPRIVRSPERLASMQMLEQLMAEPPAEPAPQPAVRRRSRVLTIAIALVALLIVGALLAVLLTQRLGLAFGAVAAPVPAAVAAAELVTNLPANRPVVLAYEWDAQRLGELRALEDTVVGQLATRKDVPLIFVSTDPQGALLANERVAQLNALNDQYHLNGLGYANLGFKAGGPLALRRFAANASFGTLFAQDASGIDLRSNDVTMESMCGSSTAAGCSWDNVSLLVVIADDVDDVRGWFEQIRSEHPDLQTLLLTTAEIAPQTQPYAAVSGVTALSGLHDAEAYGRALGAPSERLGRQVDATAIGGALFAAAVIVGGVPAWFVGWRSRRTNVTATEEQAWER